MSFAPSATMARSGFTLSPSRVHLRRARPCAAVLPETPALVTKARTPLRRSICSSWGAKPFPRDDRSGKLVVLASGYAEDQEALRIRADARLLGGTVKAGTSVTYESVEGRHLYLVPATGRIEIDGQTFEARR